MNIVGIIPARGGSKGIPRKNVQLLAGKPLIAWTIEAALGVAAIDKLVVSTDDAEIAGIAQRYGVDVIDRPEELAGDTASSEAALVHSLEFLAQKSNYRADLCVFLQCTSPLMLSADIDGTIQTCLKENADSAFSAQLFHGFLWKRGVDGDAVSVNHDHRTRIRRQDLEKTFLENGAVYVMRLPEFVERKHRFFGRTVWFEMPPERSLEIDEPFDLIIAEEILRRRCQSQPLLALPDPIAAIVFDFDGVFTDNTVHVSEDGIESVRCSRSDGLGLARLKEKGIPLLVLSTERNPVVGVRCQKLGLPCIQGIDEKETVLNQWLKEQHLDPKHVLFVGNDINDLHCMTRVGCGVAVADAHPDVMNAAQIILTRSGGCGAIRELCDLIQQKFKEATLWEKE